ncbi:MAG: S41 family peptidase [Crocinitomicaceae bacterium]|nr:S41 family peptidase [Crocinitomicaceae bacterium]
MENNNNLRIWTPILIGATLAIGIFFGRKMATPGNLMFGVKQNSNTNYQKIQDVIDIIDNYYVDSVNSQELFEKTISDMLHQLDPHSNYISAKDLQLAKEQMKGEFSGVGIRFFIIRDTVCVTNVVKNSPSDFVGVKAGDKIVKVDGKKVAGIKIKNDDIMSRLKGPANTKVNVTFLRDGKEVVKTITRGTIPIYSVSSAFMLNNETGFVKIDQFSVTTADEFRNASKQLLAKGMKKMILDLRNNTGGVMQSATTIVDEFLPANKVIVSTKGKHLKEQIYRATSNGILEKIDVVVLINENSASASEIVAGALQDNDRATIVGRRSFGKGLVQEDMLLRDNSSLRLTVARYYTPTGRSIQKPYNGNIEEYYHEEMDRYDKGELFHPDSSLFVDSLKFTTPKGKVVYGGGGIMPDVFVALDTTGGSWYLTQLRYALTFQSFAFDFAHGKYNQWNNPQEYAQSFQISDALLNQYLKYAETEFGIAINQKSLTVSKSLIKLLLKAEIARQIWTEDGYYSVMSLEDKEVKEALRHL